MWSRLLLIPVSFLLISASPAVPVKELNETGRVLAELDDWRAMMFVMLFIIVTMLFSLLWAFGKLAKTIEAISSVREAISTLSIAAISGGTDAALNRESLLRMQSTMERLVEMQQRRDQ